MIGSFPSLQKLAEGLAQKLTVLDSKEANSTRRQLQEISLTLRSWEGKQPSDMERNQLISHLTELIKKAHQLLATRDSLPP